MSGLKQAMPALVGLTICGLLILPGGGDLRAQAAAAQECCCDLCVDLNRTLVTGDPVKGTDPWTIESVVPPLPASFPFTAPGLANVETPPFPGWGLISGTSWVGPRRSPGPPDPSAPGGDYTYERHFNLCRGFTNPKLVVRLLADNSATVFLNGCTVGVTKGGIKGFVNPPTVLPSPPATCFQAGCNTLRVVVNNDGVSPTGLDLSATLTATKGLCK